MIAAACGFDWLFIDMEHGAMSVDDATRMCMAALSQGVTPIVRCCKDALFEGARCLDNGAMGVVVPHVDTAAEAEAVVRAFRYPPLGEGSRDGAGAQYGFVVADAAAIAALPGLDCLMIGTSDLTAAMGIAGRIGHPEVRAAHAKVAGACAAAGRHMGMGGVYEETVAPDYIAPGARFILSGSDHAFLMAGGGARARFLRGLQR